jgi:hypothetical protein
MNTHNLYFLIQPANQIVDGNDELRGNLSAVAADKLFWSPADTLYAQGAHDEVIVMELEESWHKLEDFNYIEIIARYCWQEWIQLWVSVISRDYPGVNNENLMTFDLSAWDNDIIAEIAERNKEVLVGHR